MGYMSPSLDIFQDQFVQHCEQNPSGDYLDIGCGYGVATIPLVLKGCKVLACDLEKGHLNFLKNQIPKDKRKLLTLKKGHFPDEIQFQMNSFDGINVSMVLHFLSTSQIEKALEHLFYALKPGGKLFITTSSPYQRTLSKFSAQYEKRKKLMDWPGYIDDISTYVPQRAHLLPKENIVFCPDELEKLLTKFGFRVVQATFFSRDPMPPDLAFDGREYSGIIGEKPLSSSLDFLEKYKEPNPTTAANAR